MCQVKRESSPCESSSSIASTSSAAAATVPAGAIKKRPAGRTRYRETRHPVFRGVRSRSRAGGRCRWVCEVRVPGHRGRRLWLGTFDSPEHAARAHDAAMLAVLGAAADHGCLLNFPDSAWLLDVPPLGSDGADVIRRAMARAVEAFLMLRSSSRHDAEDAMSATSETTMTPAAVHDDDAATEEAKGDERSPFEMDVMGDMGAGLYYASLAQGLLMDPPAASDASWCCDDSDVAVVPLWTY